MARGNPRGNPNIREISKKTRINGSNAVEMAAKSIERRRALKPLKLCMKGIASEVAYGKPPLNKQTLQPVADFFQINVEDVTFMHLAFFRLGTEMSKGDQQALDRMALYIGEKPNDKVEIVSTDFTALDEAFDSEEHDT